MAELMADKILAEIGAIHKAYPTLRIGIIIQSALDLKKRTTNVNFHEISSKQFYNALVDLHEKYKNKE